MPFAMHTARDTLWGHHGEGVYSTNYCGASAVRSRIGVFCCCVLGWGVTYPFTYGEIK